MKSCNIHNRSCLTNLFSTLTSSRVTIPEGHPGERPARGVPRTSTAGVRRGETGRGPREQSWYRLRAIESNGDGPTVVGSRRSPGGPRGLPATSRASTSSGAGSGRRSVPGPGKHGTDRPTSLEPPGPPHRGTAVRSDRRPRTARPGRPGRRLGAGEAEPSDRVGAD